MHALSALRCVPHRYAYLVPNIGPTYHTYHGIVVRIDLDASFDTSAVETLDLEAP